MVAWFPVMISFLASKQRLHSLQFIASLSPQQTTTHRRTKLASTMAASFPTEPTSPEGREPRTNWMIRPATVHDRDGCAALIQRSYGTLLAADYTEECLANCLPLITSPRQQLLTCNTWYVVEHPSTRQIVGCGGWTLRRPRADSQDDKGAPSNDEATVSADPPKTRPQLVPHLRHFAVHPDYARMGIASAIWQRTYREIQNQFASENLPFPTLEVYSTLTAEPFYASLGFVTVQRVEIELVKASVFPCILMRRAPST
jgi:GNAT superfamily N-acetyltransferase